jgi:hypothetical protein
MAAEENFPEEFTYRVNNNQVTITGYRGKNKDLVIPPTIEGYPVTAIAPEAFKGKGNGFDSYHLVDSIVLPEGLLSIGAEAFSINPIEELKLPDSLIYIGDRAFAFTRIRELTIPEGVIHIGDMAFAFTPVWSSDERTAWIHEKIRERMPPLFLLRRRIPARW